MAASRRCKAKQPAVEAADPDTGEVTIRQLRSNFRRWPVLRRHAGLPLNLR